MSQKREKPCPKTVWEQKTNSQPCSPAELNAKREWHFLPLFQDLTSTELQEIARHSSVKTIPCETLLLSTEKFSFNVYILLKGRVKIYVTQRHGYNVTLALREAGELLGEISALDGFKPSANVITTEVCDVLAMPQAHFLHCWRHMAALSFNIALVSTPRMRSATSQIAVLSTLDARCRIARQLRALAGCTPGLFHVMPAASLLPTKDFCKLKQCFLPPKLTQQELAEMVGCSREQVNRVLRQFVSEGIIVKCESKVWEISDAAKLNAYCE